MKIKIVVVIVDVVVVVVVVVESMNQLNQLFQCPRQFLMLSARSFVVRFGDHMRRFTTLSRIKHRSFLIMARSLP